MIHLTPAYLLRRHVAHRSNHRAGISVYFARGYVGLRDTFSRRLDQFRDPEIKNFDAVVFRDEEVVRFQIAMNDAFLMRRREPVRHLNRVIDRFALRDWAMVKAILQ